MPRYTIAKHGLATMLLTLLALAPAFPAHADGVILITQAKALAGNITPGDGSGYPVTLSRPGSYELAGNLAVPAGSDGIQITAHDVTVDLHGFRIHGSGTANNGIDGTTNGSTIRNGTIEHFKNYGIFLIGRYTIVEDMRVVGNDQFGIAAGDEAHIRSSTSSENGVDGVSCGSSCLVERSTTTSNDGAGIACGYSCHAHSNVVSFNGLSGIYLLDGLVLGNTISHNISFGISGSISTSAVYGDNVLTGNNQGGTQAQGVSSLHANFCYPGACP